MKDTIRDFCLLGLTIDGDHHKRWCFEQILLLAGFDLAKLSDEHYDDYGYTWEPGIAP